MTDRSVTMEENRALARLVISAPQGRSGKTTIAIGLCAALRARGLAVQPYKKGPDYIDPSWLGEAAGRACRCLDPFFYQELGALRQAFTRWARDADISIIEGNHGLFDSFDDAGQGSTAFVARELGAPILLVVNTARLGRSAAAIVHGFQTFEPDTNIAGVVLNNVARGRQESRIRLAIEEHCRIPVLGAIPRDDGLVIPDRHLGLIPRAEQDAVAAAVVACQAAAQKYLDIGRILGIARSAPACAIQPTPGAQGEGHDASRPRVGIVRDRAFTFYYPENLEALEACGAELVFIDALAEAGLPPIDGLYIGGGFPEVFMDELSANAGLRVAIRRAIEDDLPVYAECGGMMYLSRRIRWGAKSAEMVGALPCEVELTGHPQGHGYVTAAVEEDNPFFQKGTILRGHEFHNSRIVMDGGGPRTAYRLSRGNGLGEGRDGITYRSVLASYTHLHVAGALGWAEAVVRRARIYREARSSGRAR